MSKAYYLRCKALHDLPKFASKTQRIQVGNGQYVGVLFEMPVINEICGHRLESPHRGRFPFLPLECFKRIFNIFID